MFINTASMYLGILDWLIEWLTTFLTWLIQWAIDILVTVFAELFYSIGAMLMRFADLVQLMFKRLAGLGTYWTVGSDGKTAEKTGDILLDLVTNKAVLQVFLALSLIAVVMVVAGSIIQVVRTEYTTEGSRNSKAGIMGQALKSLMLFFIVPLASVFGIYISSFLLKAIDTATNVSGSSTISGQIFVAAASESNKAKMGDGKGAFGGGNQVDYGAGWDWANGAGKSAIEALGINLSSITGQKHEQAAKLAILIDKAYAQSGGEDSVGGAHPGVDSWNVKYLNVVEVSKCYNIRNMNFIVLWFGGGLAFYMLLMAAFGMIMRLFKATVLFVVAPPVVGLMPLDGGNAFKQWRKRFIGSIVSAYGTIISLNLLFLIIPILNNIYIFPNEYWYSAQNNFVHLLFTLVAMFMLKDSSKMIADILDVEDAMSSGEGMAKKVGSAAVSTAMAVGTGGAALAAGGMKMAGGIASKVNAGRATKAAERGDAASAQKYLAKSNNAKGGWGAGRTLGKVASKNPLLSKGNKMLSDFTGIDAQKTIAGAKKAHSDKMDDLAENSEKRIANGTFTAKDLKYADGGYRSQKKAANDEARRAKVTDVMKERDLLNNSEVMHGADGNGGVVAEVQKDLGGLNDQKTSLEGKISSFKNITSAVNTAAYNAKMGDSADAGEFFNKAFDTLIGAGLGVKLSADKNSIEATDPGAEEDTDRIVQAINEMARNIKENKEVKVLDRNDYAQNERKELQNVNTKIDVANKIVQEGGQPFNVEGLTNALQTLYGKGNKKVEDTIENLRKEVQESVDKAKADKEAGKMEAKLDAIIKALKSKK